MAVLAHLVLKLQFALIGGGGMMHEGWFKGA